MQPGPRSVAASDFNFHHSAWDPRCATDDNDAEPLLAWMEERALLLGNADGEPTHESGSVIDLALMSSPLFVTGACVELRDDLTCGSDHFPLLVSLPLPRHTVVPSPAGRFLMDKLDKKKFDAACKAGAARLDDLVRECRSQVPRKDRRPPTLVLGAGGKTHPGQLRLAHSLERTADLRDESSVLTFDIKGAFDAVHPNRMVKRLVDLGCPAGTCRWVSSFLAGRRASLTLDGVSDALQPTGGSLPQGSPISPILFMLFMSPLFKMPLPRTLRGYADDGCLVNSDSSLEGNCSVLSRSLELVDS
ncbi:uncharacterized protein BROUX77_003936 [Berkeleyomyces rouxiae]|uniref:uncharacterized protein n=1 Tax=Berkeleyomyces rouxiae TaxID=2035830 RepID=UPI003B7706C1